MNNISILRAKYFNQKSWIWITIAACWGLIIVKTIIDGDVLYAGIIVLSPLLLYLFIHKPFIFPFGLYAFSLPFESLFVLTGAGRGPTLAKLLGVLSMCAILLKGHFDGRLKRPDALNIWWILFMFYAFLSITWATSNAGTMRISTGLGLLLLYVSVSLYQIEKKEYEQLKWILIAAGVVTALLTIYSYQMLLAIKGISDRTSMVLNDREAALNALPYDVLISLSLCTAMIMKQKKIIMKGLFFLFVVMILFAIILTGSRGGLAAALTVLIVHLLYIENLNKKIAFALVISLAAIIIIPFIPEFMIERINTAIAGDSAEGHASGRTDIWIVGLYALKKYWLFGVGLDNFPMAYDEFVDFHYNDYLKPGRGPHNTYLGFFVELGIIGLSLLIIALIKHFKAISRTNTNRSDQIMLKAAFFGVLLYGMSGSVMWDKMTWFIFMMIIMYKNSEHSRYAPPTPINHLHIEKN